MSLRSRHVARHEVSLADVLVRAAMARIELDGAPVMLEREVVLLEVAMGKTEHGLQVRVVGMAQLRALEKARGLRPVLFLGRPLTRRVVLVTRYEIRIRIGRIGGSDRGECHDRRQKHAGANEAGATFHRIANFFALTSSGRAVSASLASPRRSWY